MRTSLLCASFLAILFAGSPALAVEPEGFVAIHRIGGKLWVELARLEEGVEPDAGRDVVMEDDFFHASRRSIPGARPMGTPVRLIGDASTCDGTLGRPAYLGVYYGDDGYGGGPAWVRAAPVRGCRGNEYVLGVLSPAGAARVGHRRTDGAPLTDAVALATAQARAALTTSAGWLAARRDWATSYTGEPVSSTDTAFELGDTVWALSEDAVEAECGTRLSSRMLVRRTPDGMRTEVAFPGNDSDSVVMLGDFDGDGGVELVLGQFAGAMRLVRLGPGAPADELWSTEGIPFFGCPC